MHAYSARQNDLEIFDMSTRNEGHIEEEEEYPYVI